jgi:Mrp family chromosome partitioning ATPase/capsular polysaccharide biosynthesis protein
MVLTYLRLHWMMILFCGTFLGAGLAYAAWTLLPSKYESYALLQVASTPSGIGEGGDPHRGKTAFATYVKTAAQLIKSQFVLNAALNDLQKQYGGLATLKEQGEPIKFLDEKLVVSYSEGSEIIRISMEGNNPDDVRKIVDAVKDAYFREVVEKEVQQKTSLLAKVGAVKLQLEDLMKLKGIPVPGLPAPVLASNTPSERPAEKPVAPLTLSGAAQGPDAGLIPAVALTPAVPVAAAAQVVAESDTVKRAKFQSLVQRTIQYETELTELPSTIKQRQAEVDFLEKQVNGLRHGPPAPESLAAADKDPEVMHLKKDAEKEWKNYNFKRSVSQNPDSAEVRHLLAAAKKADDAHEKLRLQKAHDAEQIRRNGQGKDLIEQYKQAMRAMQAARERQRVARVLLQGVQKELSLMPPPDAKEKEKGPQVDLQHTEIATLDAMYSRVTAQHIGLDLELKGAISRVTKRQDASTPLQKDTKKQVLGTVFAGLMGFGLIGLGVVAHETRVRKVSSLGELRATGPTAVVGVVPWMPDGGTARDPAKRADVNEAIDKLRSYVAQTWLARGATTVAVTSPLGDEGKSFTAFGLASSLAQAGYRTLLIDFDLRNPSLHPYAGVPNGVGVCELLRSETEARHAVLTLPNGLHFLPAGKWSDEARQAAVGGRLETLLARLREPFDCVVLHGHALLTAAESVEVARRAEVVLLCTLYRETRLPLLKRAAERVAAMEVPYSGVVYLGATPNEALC